MSKTEFDNKNLLVKNLPNVVTQHDEVGALSDSQLVERVRTHFNLPAHVNISATVSSFGFDYIGTEDAQRAGLEILARIKQRKGDPVGPFVHLQFTEFDDYLAFKVAAA